MAGIGGELRWAENRGNGPQNGKGWGSNKLMREWWKCWRETISLKIELWRPTDGPTDGKMNGNILLQIGKNAP